MESSILKRLRVQMAKQLWELFDRKCITVYVYLFEGGYADMRKNSAWY